ncbi:related to cytochrome p450, putative-Talaromyces stipitatus [Serendipita indica DSM 11827]|uniref:Related to cytochrome p450, putative-Talaromyces stipitatus n=1 Tax=Serendipita indica (strain DSM 11827) TaxID=1109443 RepID=G4TAU2_SERID|nr:related to cytochrome p450, putative-Talaromyces stipitatus [Serendipita indica DSM 11827]
MSLDTTLSPNVGSWLQNATSIVMKLNDGEDFTTLLTATNGFILLGTVLAGYVIRLSVKGSQTRPGEPPLLPGAVPLLGHALKFGSDSNGLYENARDWSPNAEPVSLSLMGKRVYLLLNARDVNAGWRAKSLSFDPVCEWGLSTMFGMSVEGVKQMGTDPDGLGGMTENQHAFWRDALAPGDALNLITQRFMNQLDSDLADYERSVRAAGSVTAELRDWTRTRLGIQSTNAFAGKALLEKDPKMLHKLAIWDLDFYLLSIGLPKWMLSRANKNLESMIQTWIDINRTGSSEVYHPMMRRLEMMEVRGASEWDKGSANFCLWMATQANALPIEFWFVYQIALNKSLQPTLLAEIGPAFDENNKIVNLNHLLHNAPLLNSIYWESLRYTSGAVSVREVLEDTVINGYTFYAGSMVMSPMRILNFSKDTFGPDANDFVPDRFVRPHNPEKGQYNPGIKVVKSFGGGVTLCPGRHFAGNEILAFTASILQRFKIELVEGQKIAYPLTSAPVVGTFPADREVFVRLSPRN